MRGCGRMGELHILNHPLIQHKLTYIRDKTTGTKQFRELVNEVTMLMGLEITRHLPLTTTKIETPVTTCESNILTGKKIGLIPILRAGLGMLDGKLVIGVSADDAKASLKKHGAKSIKLMCLVGAKEGVDRIQQNHPDVDVYLSALDEELNEHGYIVPGLGDAGDRLFGTK